jgi:hypothetical protein
MIAAFKLNGYSEADAVAFAFMTRVYDAVLMIIGTSLLAYFGLLRFVKAKEPITPGAS